MASPRRSEDSPHESPAMISCHDVAQATRYVATAEAKPSRYESVHAVNASASTDDDPRMSEILTVLNDVFDSFCAPSESGILTGIHTAC